MKQVGVEWVVGGCADAVGWDGMADSDGETRHNTTLAGQAGQGRTRRDPKAEKTGVIPHSTCESLVEGEATRRNRGSQQSKLHLS